ncbi:MAG: DUF1858 domain-containing protein [Desulfohalobiaceae bacterium]
MHKSASEIWPEMTVKNLLEQHPKATLVFFRLGMLCPGCPAEAFHTLREAALEHSLDPDILLQRLRLEIFVQLDS